MHKVDYFIKDITVGWDGMIYMRSVPGKLDWRELTKPLPCGNGYIQAGYRWNGASVGPFRKIPLIGFPKWKHPIASCRHDWRCEHSVDNRTLRKIADKMFKADIPEGQDNKILSKWEQLKGYFGVRMGAIF